jgi:RNA-binding protein YhbY
METYEKPGEESPSSTEKKPQMTEHVKNIFNAEPSGGVAGILPMLGGYGGGGWGGAGAGAGAGLGAGLLGGVLGGALLNNRGGLFGNNNGEGGNFVTPTQLANSTSSIIDANQNTVLLQAVGDVKAAVPLAEAQVQLALAGQAADLNRAIGASENLLVTGQAGINKNISDSMLATLQSQNSINVNVLTSANSTKEAVALYGNANLVATKDAATATALAVANSTKEILAALNEQNTANLQRQLTVAEQALFETRAESRARGTEVNVTQTVNQNQLQLQAQTQAQAQLQVLAQLAANVNNLANDIQAVRQTQSNVNFGVQGNAGQTASAANNRVN